MSDEPAVNGVSPTHHNTTLLSDSPAEQSQSPLDNVETSISHNGERPAKKQKTADIRPISPPWRRFTAAGPTSFMESGKRRSGRTNMVPMELQPPGERRQTRAVIHKAITDRSKDHKPTYALSRRYNNHDAQVQKASIRRPSQSGPGRPAKTSESPTISMSRHAKATSVSARPSMRRDSQNNKVSRPKLSKAKPTIEELRRKQHELQQLVKQSRSTTVLNEYNSSSGGSTEDELSESSAVSNSSNPSSPPTFRLRLIARLKSPTVTGRLHMSQKRQYETFEQFLHRDFRAPLSRQEITQEAELRLRIGAARSSGLLPCDNEEEHEETITQKEPDRQYAHRDHLLGHVVHFAKLLKQEHRDHRRKAAVIANEAKRWVEEKQRRLEDEAKRAEEEKLRHDQEQRQRVATEEDRKNREAERNRVKTPAEVEQLKRQQWMETFRNVMLDLMQLWMAVETEVPEILYKEAEEAKAARLKRRLERVLARRQQQLEESMKEVGESDIESVDESSDDENMTDSDISGDDIDGDDGNPDEDLSPEALRQKYANLPALETHTHDNGDVDMTGNNNSDVEATGELQLIMGKASTRREYSEDEQDDAGRSAEDDEDVDMDDDTAVSGVSSAVRRRTRAGSADSSRSLGNSELDSDESVLMDSEAESEDDQDEESEADDESEDLGLAGFLGKREIERMRMSEEVAEASTEEVLPNSKTETSVTALTEAKQQSPSTEMNANKWSHVVVSHKTDSQLQHAADLNNGISLAKPQFHKVASTEASEHDPDSRTHEYVDGEDRTSLEPSTQASPQTSATKASEPESISSVEPRLDSQPPATPSEVMHRVKTPVPPLLRGQLRIYQHEGLDWLADLYARGRNGILADEMGLGKTIQSIALLAHLATTYEVWGPHLIVVPTSVMLNWEMEFKKFCPGFKILTYYGSQQERAQKRKGWMSQDAFNVCITSYQLVLQDQNMFRRRAWHYMILDEAHNIKNFKSDRWQIMMTFNTKARLLLTGTPLQNNLTELWSLLYFLDFGHEGDSDEVMADLKTWTEWFKAPVNSILEQGNQSLSEEDQESVRRLHKLIRPFLLRRMKKDVEKQMPLKYEHVELCRLSKRQRQLYDGFMSRAATKETLSSGNYLSIINALMQLRKVCNHPDLFETRPITTSLSLPTSEAKKWSPNESTIRRLLTRPDPFHEIDLGFLQLCPISREDISANEVLERTRLFAYSNSKFLQIRDAQWKRVNQQAVFSGNDVPGVMESLKDIRKASVLQDLDRTVYIDTYRHRGRPLMGRALLQDVAFGTVYEKLSRLRKRDVLPRLWESDSPIASLDLVQSLETRAQHMEPFIQKFACVTPTLTAADLTEALIPTPAANLVRCLPTSRQRDPFHEVRMKLSIAFPDKRLLQYDCGKLQRLDQLLRRLAAGGHRALIFTQMTKVLDLLEQFLNIHGHRYLRLDGSTKIEQRQILTDRFNGDPKVLCFILSSRSGGLGINLTGADTVIFYDLDWNPAMDKQCTDRAHRIGQTRDVHIYRFVSEHTIEANILKKASQKEMLDDVVVQKGDFTTDYFSKISDDNVASLAMNRVLGTGPIQGETFEGAEDKEDVAAAKVAVAEDQHADEGDFEDRATPRSFDNAGEQALGPYAATNAALAAAEEESQASIDSYLIRQMKWLMKDRPVTRKVEDLVIDKKMSKKRRDQHLKRAKRDRV